MYIYVCVYIYIYILCIFRTYTCMYVTLSIHVHAYTFWVCYVFLPWRALTSTATNAFAFPAQICPLAILDCMNAQYVYTLTRIHRCICNAICIHSYADVYVCVSDRYKKKLITHLMHLCMHVPILIIIMKRRFLHIMSLFSCVYLCMRACACKCIFACLYKCIYVCKAHTQMYILSLCGPYIYIYIYTYIYIYIYI
jgi:hypothetical protein